jgi:hypothetical protein
MSSAAFSRRRWAETAEGLRRRGPNALKFLLEASDRGVGGRAEEIWAVPLQAHRGEKGREIGASKDSPRASGPRCVHRVAPVVEQHPEAHDRLSEGARGEAHLGEVFGREGDGDHCRATFE